MAVTHATLRVGAAAPDFSLPDATGRLTTLDDLGPSPALVVLFLSNTCPYVIHIARELALLTQRMRARGVAVVAINSNDPDDDPGDATEHMAGVARRLGWDFPYLRDEDQSVAGTYGAACTPDVFVFDGERRLVYRGQFDASRPGNDVPVTGEGLRAAVEAAIAGQAVPEPHPRAIGCRITWRPGNEPPA